MDPEIKADSVEGVLVQALKIEEYGKTFFTIMAKTAPDKESARIFKQLAAEEAGHINLIRHNLVGRVTLDLSSPSIEPEKVFLPSMDEMAGKSVAEVLEHAIKLEERIISVYRRGLTLAADTKTSEMILNLVEFESRHREMLTNQLIGLVLNGKRDAPASMPAPAPSV